MLLTHGKACGASQTFGTGTLVPIGWRGDESAGIYRFPVPVLSTKFGREICGSEASLIIEPTKISEPTYHSWLSALSLSLFSASFVLQFRRIDEPLLVTAFMTRRPLSLLGPPPPSPHLLYNRLSARFIILLPPRVPILNLHVSSHPLHPSLSPWLSLPLQDVPDPPPPPPVNPVKRHSPLNANTERCSRMAPVKSGLRASRKFSSMVRSSLPLPLPHLTCPMFQACGNTGNHPGLRTRAAAADGATSSSSTT